MGAQHSGIVVSVPKYLSRTRVEQTTTSTWTEFKRCVGCGIEKSVTDFYRNGGGMPGWRSYCKPCHKIRRREAYQRAGGSAVPHAQLLRREYGMTPADYEAMLKKQAHRCAICHRPETIRSRKTGEPHRLSVDHDHVTGKIRGLLCLRCNRVVWALEENHLALPAIHTYLEQFRASFAAL